MILTYRGKNSECSINSNIAFDVKRTLRLYSEFTSSNGIDQRVLNDSSQIASNNSENIDHRINITFINLCVHVYSYIYSNA